MRMAEVQDGDLVERVRPVLLCGPLGEPAYGLLLGCIERGLAPDRQRFGHAFHANVARPPVPCPPFMLPECVTRSTRPN